MAEVLLLPPTFGELLRRLRQGRGVSREKLAVGAGMSVSYLTHLERGERGRPTRAVVENLVRCLDGIRELPCPDRRHLFDLAGIREADAPSVERLRTETTADMRHGLALRLPHAAGYFDARWYLLAGNAAVGALFPGLREGDNILHWLFGDERARRALLDWDRAAALSVAGLRGRIGRLRAGEHFAGLLAELGRYPEFRVLWGRGEVTYFHEPPRLRFRDADGGSVRALDFHIYDVDSGSYPGWVHFFGAGPAPE
ncbi:helix-turn-helix domain-containing protein [Nocardia bovistercoris]|nr:helix-turn-helix transcriptional regulator [Nocardia bovistercoris]